jgi:hypothetical protein
MNPSEVSLETLSRPELLLRRMYGRNWQRFFPLYRILDCFLYNDPVIRNEDRQEIRRIIAEAPEFIGFKAFWSMLTEEQRTCLLAGDSATIESHGRTFLFHTSVYHKIIRVSPKPIIQICLSSEHCMSSWEMYAMQFWYLTHRPDFVETQGNSIPKTGGDIEYYRSLFKSKTRMIRHLDLLVSAL